MGYVHFLSVVSALLLAAAVHAQDLQHAQIADGEASREDASVDSARPERPNLAEIEDRRVATEAEDLTGVIPSVLGQFTTAVENREPIDQVTFVSNDLKTIYFFSDLRGLEGQTITHRWIFEGKSVAEVDFEVKGSRWRVWSSKDLLEDWTGDWTVEIVRRESGDRSGPGSSEDEVIAAETFTYSAAGN